MKQSSKFESTSAETVKDLSLLELISWFTLWPFGLTPDRLPIFVELLNRPAYHFLAWAQPCLWMIGLLGIVATRLLPFPPPFYFLVGFGFVGGLTCVVILRVGFEIQWRVSQEVQKKAAEVAASPGIDEALVRRERMEDKLFFRT
jgi:hypothetical protein